MIGRVLGSYRLVEKIGEGGMGAVYRAVDEMLDREVAIKAIRPDLAREPHIAERFRSEARLLAKVQHPAIATIYSFFQAGENGEELFLAMEFVRGRTLSEVIAAEGPMPQARVSRLMGTAFEGIEHAHESGIIHRDLKPENLMLTASERVKVMDFGIARLTGESHLTRTGLLVGTLRYMAPEQIRGEEVDRRTDIYSLGIVLYQLLAGRVPFDGNTDYAILRAQLEDEPPPLRSLAPAVSTEVERTVLRALAKDPAERFATVAELNRALRLALGPSAETGVRPRPAFDPAAITELDSTLPLPRSTGAASVAPASAPTSASQRLPPSLPTVETPRRQPEAAPQASPPVLPPALPPTPSASTSYRPIEGPGWKKWALAAAAVVVVSGVGFGLWSSLRPSPGDRLEGSGTDGTGLAQTSDLTASGTPVSGVEPGATEGDPASRAGSERESFGAGTAPNAVPPRTVPAGSKAQSSLPAALPPPSTPGQAPATEPALPPAPTAETPAAPPSAIPAPAEAVPGSEALADVPTLEEMKRLSSQIVEEGERLVEVYQAFLDQKDDRSEEELGPNDLALRDEIEAMNEAAERFDAFFNAGVLARARNRLRKPNEAATRADLQRRSQPLGAKIARIDQMMASIGPDADVRQSWGKIRADWMRARQRLSH